MNEKQPINHKKKEEKKKKKKKHGKKDKKHAKDKENKEEKEEEKSEKSSSDEEDKGCCSKFGDCLSSTWISCMYCIKSCCNFSRKCCGKTIYPCKERCCSCLIRVDNKLNPYKDAGYSEV